MEIFRGGPAFSSFRLEKRLQELSRQVPIVCGICAEFQHFVLLSQPLDTDELDRLRALLDYGCADQLTTQAATLDGTLFLVVPRPGTTSPWSSKATEIARNCGLGKVRRLERGIAWRLRLAEGSCLDEAQRGLLQPLIHDRMTEVVLHEFEQAEGLFSATEPEPLREIPLLQQGREALVEANSTMGLALSADEIDYLRDNFSRLQRDPTDVELMMFAQANSEHCRHKIFNAHWSVDDVSQGRSLFDMIRLTHELHPSEVLSAYSDNAAVTRGYDASRFFPSPQDRCYVYTDEAVHLVAKVETHNHPTAISPYPGAATGAGGEIRDEGATGRGAKPKAGLTGFSVSNLNIPGYPQPWEGSPSRPRRQASALEIMLDGPVGAASFNNEFGRPALAGYFRSYEQGLPGAPETERRGYHKPIMLAGGYANIRPQHTHKDDIPAGAKVVVLGGPAMLIGLGGGAASSMSSGDSEEALDFASVQRHNPEMQRRCQEVIDRCWALGDRLANNVSNNRSDGNPILSIHDVGAGGLSNAVPELLNDHEKGGRLELRAIFNADPSLSPLEIWCNEAQERYVLAIDPEQLALFERICGRERCPYAVIGTATAERQLLLTDREGATPVDMPMSVLLGKLPTLNKATQRGRSRLPELVFDDITLSDAVQRILRLPAVADKRFLISIGDRSVSGLVVRDQMVGPWQVPVADCAVTASSFQDFTGEAMAFGERSPVALIDAPASGRLAVAEAITNIAAARIRRLGDVILSANWMAANGHGDEDARLLDTVRAVGMELCPALGIVIPVGKDSLSMKTVWQEQGTLKTVTAPLSLAITAFAPVLDVRQSLTPRLVTNVDDTVLLLIDLGRGNNRLGGSCLSQVYNQLGAETADLDSPADLRALFRNIQLLNEMGLLLAYHDRSDGGLFVTLCEMALAGRTGLEIFLDDLGEDLLGVMFSEELGAVIQIHRQDMAAVYELFRTNSTLADHVHLIGQLTPKPDLALCFKRGGERVYQEALMTIQRLWSETSFQMQSLRDNSDCARQEYEALQDASDPGLSVKLSYDPAENPALILIDNLRPKVAVLREQGVNGQNEMAAAFQRAGFDCIDVHMSDIISGDTSLRDFQGLAACGGFSYGDVLGAGGGWAKSILYNNRALDEFSGFFQRTDTFTLGVCNGCQMLAQLQSLIPGAEGWPNFERNLSEQFESRLVMVEILQSPSILLTGMVGSLMPIVVAHGEGRIVCNASRTADSFLNDHTAILRYVDNLGKPTENYPANPNGSPAGITGLTTTDGRVTLMMPHPERVFLAKQYSWLPSDWRHEEGPWLRLFQNARSWVL